MMCKRLFVDGIRPGVGVMAWRFLTASIVGLLKEILVQAKKASASILLFCMDSLARNIVLDIDFVCAEITLLSEIPFVAVSHCSF